MAQILFSEGDQRADDTRRPGRLAHLCIDVQGMFAEPTDWHTPWLNAVLPAIEALVDRAPQQTLFTRFVPPPTAEDAPGAWKGYYQRWPSMTRDRLDPDLIDIVPSLRRFVPPARVLDKPAYSPWLGTGLHAQLQQAKVNRLLISGGETDVCVLTAVLGAIDLGYHVFLPTDAVFGSADQTHDAVLTLYRSRFAQQLTTMTTTELLETWEEIA
jgi:nicotinamidase-related amidase